LSGPTKRVAGCIGAGVLALTTFTPLLHQSNTPVFIEETIYGLF
jgi:hypothetical protein